MADDPYASIAKPVDPYADIAKPVGVNATPAPTRASTFGGGMIEGAKDLRQGLTNIPQAILHPVNTFNAMGAQQRALADRASADAKAGHYGNAVWHGIDAMVPGLGPLDAQLTDEYQSGTPGAKSAAMGRTLVNALPSVAAEGARPIISQVVPKIGAGLNNMAISADADYGANAGRGLYNAGVVGNSARGILKKVNQAAGEAANAHNADLAQYGAGQKFSLRPAINQPFDDAIAAKTNPRTGAVTPAQVVKARQVQGILNSAQDPATGRPLQVGLGPNGRDLTNYTPLEANKLKSNVYGMTDYDDPHNNSLANNALKGAASNIKQTIDANVPESVASGQHLHDLMSASDALKGGGGMELSRGGIIDAATKAGLTTGAQVLRTGVDAVNSGPGRVLSRVAPVLAPRMPLQPQEPADWPYQDDVEQPDQAEQDNGNANNNGSSDLEDEQHSAQSIPAQAENETKTFPQADIGALPSPVRRLLSSTGLQLKSAPPHAGAQNMPAIASVDPGSPNTINVEDAARFNASGPQTLGHESVHLGQNNWTPEMQAQIPPDDPHDPYNYGGTEGLKAMRDQGKKLWNLPREKAATVVQYYISQGGEKAPKAIRDAYEPWVKDLNDAPLSTIKPTDPNASSLETQPRAPLGQMYSTQTFAKGEPPPMQKGTPVTLPDGSRGKVAHVIQGMGTVRVRTDDGRNLTVRTKALKVIPHVMVQSHARRITEK